MMPRYHFNVLDGRSRPDATGTTLRDADEARYEAVYLAGELLKSDAERIGRSKDWRLEVTDRAGLVLFRIDVAVFEGGNIDRQPPPI